jgi:hypothetical protein
MGGYSMRVMESANGVAVVSVGIVNSALVVAVLHRIKFSTFSHSVVK